MTDNYCSETNCWCGVIINSCDHNGQSDLWQTRHYRIESSMTRLLYRRHSCSLRSVMLLCGSAGSITLCLIQLLRWMSITVAIKIIILRRMCIKNKHRYSVYARVMWAGCKCLSVRSTDTQLRHMLRRPFVVHLKIPVSEWLDTLSHPP